MHFCVGKGVRFENCRASSTIYNARFFYIRGRVLARMTDTLRRGLCDVIYRYYVIESFAVYGTKFSRNVTGVSFRNKHGPEELAKFPWRAPYTHREIIWPIPPIVNVYTDASSNFSLGRLAMFLSAAEAVMSVSRNPI